MHSHSDLFYFACPSAESKIRQGVTTEVVGMCSFSPAPVRREQQALVKGWIGGIGSEPDIPWETFGQYLDMLRALRPSVNVIHFVGHGALRIAAMGFEARPAGAGELRAMERGLGDAMDAGAWGFSTGLVYPPSAYAQTDELIALATSIRTTRAPRRWTTSCRRGRTRAASRSCSSASPTARRASASPTSVWSTASAGAPSHRVGSASIRSSSRPAVAASSRG